MAKQSDGIWIIDAKARTLYANVPMAEVLGTTSAELIDKHSLAYVFSEDLAAAQQWFEKKVRAR
jgi:PAS domain S-box-containing protein